MKQEVQLIEITCRHCVLQSHTVVLAVWFPVVLFVLPAGKACVLFPFRVHVFKHSLITERDQERSLEHPVMNQNSHEHVN